MHLLKGLMDAVDLGIAMLLLAIFLFGVATAALAFGRKKEPPVAKEITLRDLSNQWTKKEGARTIHIEELSSIWRDDNLIAGKNLRLPDLENPRAAAFMEKYVRNGSWFKKAPQQKAVCAQILKILDQEGHCPSVVNVTGDVEGKWDENTYRILSKTTLLDHSLNVAEQVVRLLDESESWHVIPDTMVAALSHDLGKLESVRGYLYSVGEHPVAAGRPLAGIEDFKKLPKKEEIERAIKLHHKMPDGLLGKTLKKADQQARQKELEEVVAHHESMPEAIPEKGPDPLLQREAKVIEEELAPVPASAFLDTTDKVAAVWQAQSDIYGESSDADKVKDTAAAVPKLMDISSWFDGEQFLESLKPYINKMFGRRFMAFSMPDGHVYFQAKVLEEVARKQGERARCMEIATMAQKDPTMQRVLLTIVQQFRGENDIIARGLIKDNYFGGYFTVIKKTGENIKGFYTPFHAEAFGSIAEMEQSKSEILRNIQSVKPYTSDDARE